MHVRRVRSAAHVVSVMASKRTDGRSPRLASAATRAVSPTPLDALPHRRFVRGVPSLPLARNLALNHAPSDRMHFF